jgi:hypothetical protein
MKTERTKEEKKNKNEERENPENKKKGKRQIGNEEGEKDIVWPELRDRHHHLRLHPPVALGKLMFSLAFSFIVASMRE